MFRFVIFAAIFSLTASSKANAYCPDGKQHYRATLRHIESGGIGYNDGYTTLEAFIASDPSQWTVTPFLDARGHIFDNGKWAANVGSGLRTLWGNRAYGINAYYDYRNVGRFKANQIGVGLETLGELFDFRMNGYLPVGKKISNPYDATFGTFSAHYMYVSQKYQTAMKGANAEFGFHFGKSESFDFYTAAGPYYFIGEKAPATWGAKARILGSYKDVVSLEFSDSYDRTFHNRFQGEIALSFSFGPKSKVKAKGCNCKMANILTDRMLQPVDRQEIIVIDKVRKKSVAIDPTTQLPYYFIFVANIAASDGTYESPYHSLAQAQANSSPNDIIYVFPGDGTTRGMDSGIALQANQKFWGSGIDHLIQTTAGLISIPSQSSSSPTITNTNIDTEGNAITLATNNDISGVIITSALNDAIFGTDPKTLNVSSCTIENTSTFAIEASFPGDASISLTDNQFLNNVNGVFLTLHGTSSVVCSDNTFQDQTSVSSVPLEIAADHNTFAAHIENNLFNNNITGSVRCSLDNVVHADLFLLNNTMTNNGTGAQSTLGSNVVIISSGTTNLGTIVLTDNVFSGNTSDSVYMHTSGAFNTLEMIASGNTMSNNGGSALVLATPADTLTLHATDNIISDCNDNGIAIISSSPTTTGTITISNNTITNIGNASNGVAINQDFSNLALTLLHNTISGCEGTGILSYAPDGVNSFTAHISENTITHCQNLSSNAASGLDIEQYTNLECFVTDNTFSDNTGTTVFIGSTLPTPSACLTLSGNSSDAGYSLSNPGDGTFLLSPCDVDSANVGTINLSGTVEPVKSCPEGTSCPL